MSTDAAQSSGVFSAAASWSGSQLKFSGTIAPQARCSRECTKAYAPYRPGSQLFGDDWSFQQSIIFRQPCMPPQQISPSAASRSPYDSAISAVSRNVRAIRFWLWTGSFNHSAGEVAERF